MYRVMTLVFGADLARSVICGVCVSWVFAGSQYEVDTVEFDGSITTTKHEVIGEWSRHSR